MAEASEWNGPYKSIGHNQPPFSQANAEDPFMWVDKRGWYVVTGHGLLWTTHALTRLSTMPTMPS